MRQQDINRKNFQRQHYEILAARFRNAWPTYDPDQETQPDEWAHVMTTRNTLINLALDMGQRFQADNSDFDPIIWMNKITPDPEKWPLSELYVEITEANNDAKTWLNETE